jgi:hypothetical protein
MAECLKDFASAGLKMKTLSVLLVGFGKEIPTTAGAGTKVTAANARQAAKRPDRKRDHYPVLRGEFQVWLESGTRCQAYQQIHAESVDLASLQIRHACLSHSNYPGGLSLSHAPTPGHRATVLLEKSRRFPYALSRKCYRPHHFNRFHGLHRVSLLSQGRMELVYSLDRNQPYGPARAAPPILKTSHSW